MEGIQTTLTTLICLNCALRSRVISNSIINSVVNENYRTFPLLILFTVFPLWNFNPHFTLAVHSILHWKSFCSKIIIVFNIEFDLLLVLNAWTWKYFSIIDERMNEYIVVKEEITLHFLQYPLKTSSVELFLWSWRAVYYSCYLRCTVNFDILAE